MSGDTDFSDWIGKSETEHGVASAYAANYFTLTLDRDDPAFADGDALPPAWHYFYFHELVALAATGEDGHRTVLILVDAPADRFELTAGLRERIELILAAATGFAPAASNGSRATVSGGTLWSTIWLTKLEFAPFSSRRRTR